ncbi:Holliday junction branch migration protein RuvA [bacterium]|nr:Holliday junction branch migration protein RuvA [bacterium]NBX97660.1 Holliday junction branch migration protein RuvA [bacterium]NDC94133.1 Holliday junction branch migration protein RuvA [bacterium]NDD83130.1 Holliday junction branch migration protein RuvA [bacterium]NDG29353.1 Holliday junction branch migration protein RuvA [bacterium]
MIAKLTGVAIDHEGPLTVIDCSGVGYAVRVLLDEQATMRLGEKSSLFIYEHIKEDAHDLYGFLTKSRKDLFERLISVNGVGPKAALAIANLGNEGQVRTAIANGDTKYISSASGVGKKVAERVVVDLKNKVGLSASNDATAFLQEASLADSDEALQALIGLGYSREDAVAVLAKIDPSLSVEARIKQALKR